MLNYFRVRVRFLGVLSEDSEVLVDLVLSRTCFVEPIFPLGDGVTSLVRRLPRTVWGLIFFTGAGCVITGWGIAGAAVDIPLTGVLLS